jgi:hypothetical protein
MDRSAYAECLFRLALAFDTELLSVSGPAARDYRKLSSSSSALTHGGISIRYISLLLAGILAYRREYLAYYAQQQDVLSLKTADLTIVPSISELAPSTIYQPPLARSSSKWSFAPSEATELPGYEETGPSRAGSRRHFTSRHSSAHFCSHCGQIDE